MAGSANANDLRSTDADHLRDRSAEIHIVSQRKDHLIRHAVGIGSRAMAARSEPVMAAAAEIASAAEHEEVTQQPPLPCSC